MDLTDMARVARISIHSTTRVETILCANIRGWRILFQSTPPRGWRLCGDKWNIRQHQISIHSTTRVETVFNGIIRLFLSISIHSTTRVETGKLERWCIH